VFLNSIQIVCLTIRIVIGREYPKTLAENALGRGSFWNFWVGMYCWDPGTLSLNQSWFS